MNLKNHYHFESIIKAGNTLQAEVDATLVTYRAEMSHIRAEASRLKDEDAYITEKQGEAITKAKAAILRANKTFSDSVKVDAHALQDELKRVISEPLNDNFIAKLKIHKDLGFPISRTEAVSLLELNDGNMVGLSVLQSVLKTTGSKYSVMCRSIEDYENDIVKVLRLAESCLYTPAEYHAEAVEIFKGHDVTFVQPDGTTFQNGTKYNGFTLIGDRANFSSVMKSAEEMKKSWSADVTNRIISRASAEILQTQTEINENLRNSGIDEKYIPELPEEPETSTSISESPQAEQIAAEHGRHTAANQATYQKSMNAYMK